MKKVTGIAIMIFFLTPFLFIGSYAYAKEKNLGYTGDITPVAADALVTTENEVYILDVRTEAEWMYVGHPGPNNCGDGGHLEDKVVNISYKIYKGDSFEVSPAFISDVNEFFGNEFGNGDYKETVILIVMCRSGKRSVDAAKALYAAGYENVYNMLTGFQGGTDECGYRIKNGWVMDGLSYTYSGAGYKD